MRDEKYSCLDTEKEWRSLSGSIMVCLHHKAELAGGILPIWSLHFFWTSFSLDYKSK